MIITKTPFRMSFFGGGTDMESFFREYGGAVLSTTFDKYCYVNVRHLPPFFSYATELSYAKTERVNSLEEIEHPAIRNAMKMLDMHHIRLTYEADLPARSGLGTSSSFAVGMLNAFYALKRGRVRSAPSPAVAGAQKASERQIDDVLYRIYPFLGGDPEAQQQPERGRQACAAAGDAGARG